MKKLLLIGAHPDDCEELGGGLALKYLKSGYKVKFISTTNGSGGHYEMKPDELAKKRYEETREVVRLFGIEYSVWTDSIDGELVASLENRKRMVKEIREYEPDLIITHRPNDYHPDHRNTSILVQDSSYLLIVPNFCPEVKALKTTPVIMHFYDTFHNPDFVADVIIDTDDVMEEKYKMFHCHASQFYEWLPYTLGELENVPKSDEERFEWMHCPRIPKGEKLTEKILEKDYFGTLSEYRFATATVQFKDLLYKRYGNKAAGIKFTEAFSVCEYGKKLTDESEKELFPF